MAADAPISRAPGSLQFSQQPWPIGGRGEVVCRAVAKAMGDYGITRVLTFLSFCHLDIGSSVGR